MSIPDRYPGVLLDEFVIMPNHFHGILVILPYDKTFFDEEGVTCSSNVGVIHELPLRSELVQIEKRMHRGYRRGMLISKVVGYAKMRSAKLIQADALISGETFWQRGYYDHIIRDSEDLFRIREYIKNNPRDWALDEYFEDK